MTLHHALLASARNMTAEARRLYAGNPGLAHTLLAAARVQIARAAAWWLSMRVEP